jgi:pyruvate,orthophosphate dikinase
MQDIEFTVQRGTLYMLQTRSGKRSAGAAIRIAVEMVAEGLISKEEAVARIEPGSLDQLLHPTLDPDAERRIVARGLPASPGAASGKIVFSANEAEARSAAGEAVILCRVETSPEDIHGMHAARGILTTRGGMTSHAAVVARGMGRPCVSGAGELRIDYKSAVMRVRGHELEAGDTITIDGGTGEVMLGQVPTVQPELSGDFSTLMGWADEFRTMGVRANAETPRDAQTARDFGAEGIGLSRTEHMFFEAGRIVAVREMILADNGEERRKALEKILPMQQQDFVELFKIMKGLPVTILRRSTSSCPTARPSWPRSPRPWGSRSNSCGRASSSSTSPIPCSATAAAVSASPSRKSMRCRPARSSRPRLRCSRRAARPLNRRS